jgi:hypothetical protein
LLQRLGTVLILLARRRTRGIDLGRPPGGW